MYQFLIIILFLPPPIQVFCEQFNLTIHMKNVNNHLTEQQPINIQHKPEANGINERIYASHELPNASLSIRDRFRRSSQNLYPIDPVSWNFLRRYIVCGSRSGEICENSQSQSIGKTNLVIDPININARDANARSLFDYTAPISTGTPAKLTNNLRMINEKHQRYMNGQISGLLVPIKYLSNFGKWKNNFNQSGRREGPLYVDEPDFVLVRSPDSLPPGPDYTDDPFIPQRGRKRIDQTGYAKQHIRRTMLVNELAENYMTANGNFLRKKREQGQELGSK